MEKLFEISEDDAFELHKQIKQNIYSKDVSFCNCPPSQVIKIKNY